MNERELKIVQAAFGRFAHYGVNKTSMSDIASAAGVARQTLYKAFESKEDLIFTALLYYAGQTKADIERDCASATEPGSRLDVLFEHLGAIPFDAMQRLPHLDEVLEIGDNLAEDRRAQIKETYKSAIRIVLSPYEAQLASKGIAPEKLHELLKGTFTQIKRDARDAQHLRELFEPIRAMLIYCVGAPGSS